MNTTIISIIAASTLLLTGCGGAGSSGETQRPPAVAPVTNTAPQVTMSGESEVTEGLSVSIVATAADNDGEIVTYQWTQVSGSPAITLNNNSGTTLSLLAPSVSEYTEFSFRVVVTDDDGATASDTFNIRVAPAANIPPQISLTGPTSINARDEVELVATASDDDGEIIQYYWSMGIDDDLPKPLEGEDSSTLTFSAPQVTQNTNFTFEVTVIDDNGQSSTASLSILVAAKANPQIKARPDSVTVFLLDGVKSQLISPLTNDITNLTPTLISVGETNLGEIEVNPNGTALFTPLRSALGTEIVSYTAMDGNVEYQGEITISVEQYVTIAAYAGADGISSFPRANIFVGKYADDQNGFGSQTNESGWFSVGSILRKPDDVFILTMTGSESNGQGAAKLTSILGTASEMLSAAQLEATGRYLIVEEYLPSIRPTHLTTSEEVLLSRAVDYRPISNLDLFNEAFQNINATSLIEYAAIIELVAFKNEVIPDSASKKVAGVSKDTTTDINSRTLFDEGNKALFTAFAQENEADIATGIEEVKTYMLTAGGKKPIGKHILVQHDQYGPIEGSGLFQFNEDDTGTFDTLGGSSSFTYQLNGNRLVATMSGSLPGEAKEIFREIYPSYETVLIKKVQFDFITSARDGLRCVNGLISYGFYNETGEIGEIDFQMFNGGIITARLVSLDSYKREWSNAFLRQNNQTSKLVLPVYIDGTWQTDLFTVNNNNNKAEGLIFKQEAIWSKSEDDDVLSFTFADNEIEYLFGEDIDNEIIAQLKKDGQIVSTKIMNAPRFTNSSSTAFDLIQTEQVWTKQISETLRSVANTNADGSPALAPRFQNGYRLNPKAGGGFGVERLTTQCNEEVVNIRNCKTWTTNSEEVSIVDGPGGNVIRFNDGVNQDGKTIYRDWYLFELSTSAHVVEVVWEDLNRDGSWSSDPRAYEPISSNPVYFYIDIPYAPLKESSLEE